MAGGLAGDARGAQDQERCYYCGREVTRGTRQRNTANRSNLIPLSRGGLQTPDNTVTAWRSCRGQKGNRTPDEYRLYLQIKVSHAARAKRAL
jgi:5-methylcytosine-specific restriction endonuclease McrA